MLCQTSSDNPSSYSKFEGGYSDTNNLQEQENLLMKIKDLELLRQSSEADQDFKDYQKLINEAVQLYKKHKNLDKNHLVQDLTENDAESIIEDLKKHIESMQKNDQVAQNYQEILKIDREIAEQKEILGGLKYLDKKEKIQPTVSEFQSVEEQKLNEIHPGAKLLDKDSPTQVHEIIWEPLKFNEKVQAFLHGSAEAIFVCLLGFFCLEIPSAVSVSLFIMANLLQVTMVFDLAYRYFYGLIVLAINFLCVFGIVIAKIVFLKKSKSLDLNNYTNDQLFKENVKLFQGLGFQLICKQGKEKPCEKIRLFKNGIKQIYTMEIDSAGSFGLEIVLFIMILVFGTYLLLQYLKIKKLLAVPFKELQEFRKLERELNAGVDDDYENEEHERKGDLGVSQKNISIQAQKEEQQKMNESKNKLKYLSTKYPKNFVHSSYYYNLNTKFFICLIFLQVVGALTAKSMLDVPTLLLILMMCSGYMIRKKISFFYVTYCFIVVYYISFIMLVKVCHDCVLSISFVQSYLDGKNQINKKDFNLIVFGSLMFKEKSTESNTDQSLSKAIYLLSTFSCFFFTQCWRSCKWMEIREKTEGLELNFISRFIQYLYIRVKEDERIKVVREQKLSGNDETITLEAQQILKQLKDLRFKKNHYDEITKKLRKTQDKSTQTKLIILWFARLLMILLAYMYHSTAGFINLTWVLASFIFPDQFVYVFSIVFMIPLILLEFVLIYSNRVAVIKDKEFFKKYGGYFQWKMEYETQECCLLFIVLGLFFSIIGIYFDTIDNKENNNELLQFFKIRIQNKKYSSAYRYLFVIFGSIHKLLLIFLFIRSLDNFNNLQSVGSLVLFVLFISSYNLYKKAGFLLLWFFAMFIIVQYYFSLSYKHFLRPEYNVPMLYWLKFFPGVMPEQQNGSLYTQNPFGYEQSSSIYFRFRPSWIDWGILFTINLVGTINDIFKDEKTVNQLNEEIQETFEAQNATLVYYIKRIQTIVNIIFLFVIVLAMILVQLLLVETNFVTWIFFLLNIANLFQLIRANRSSKELNKSILISKAIKYYSATVFIIHIIFIVFVGEFRKEGEAYVNTIDYQFRKSHPNFYNLIPYVGLRSQEYKDILFSDSEEKKSDAKFKLSMKIFFYVFIQLVSQYLESHFEEQKKQIEAENDFVDSDYKNLFEYVDQSVVDKEKKTLKESSLPNSKKKYYSQKDLIDHYEQLRFTKPFFAYRRLNHWSKMDTFATYGHLINNSIVFYIALFKNFSIYLFVNLTFIIGFYVLASLRTSKRAKLNQQVSGLQSQCDITMAKLVTKQHKTEAFREFLKLRIRVWWLQFFAFFIALLIGYPTSILSSIRNEAHGVGLEKPKINLSDDSKLLLDKTIFWFFFTGVFKDETQISSSTTYFEKYQFYIDFVLILVGLFIERNLINWLKDRFGCTYYKFQKFVELDMRREAIRSGWKNQRPNYNIERYRQHYFLNDFDDLKQKFYYINYSTVIQEKNKNLDYETELLQDHNQKMLSNALARRLSSNIFERKQTKEFSKLKEKNSLQMFSLPKTNLEKKYEKNNYGDFIPNKEGIRIRDTIKFCLQLECQSTQLNLDEQSLELLQERVGPNKQDIEEFLDEKLKQLEKIRTESNKILLYKLYIDKIYDYILKITQSPSVVVDENDKMELDKLPGLNLEDFSNIKDFEKKQKEINEIQERELSTLKRISQSQFVDYEGIPVLKKYKTDQLRNILKDNVDFKYNVSFAKGNRIIIEGVILFLIMLSLCFKCNIFSLIYLLFLFRYPNVESKSGYMVRLGFYMAVIIFINYALLLLNLTEEISPRKFPKPYYRYPDWDGAVNPNSISAVNATFEGRDRTQFYFENEQDWNNQTNWKLVHPIPFFFQFKLFQKDLLFCYLMGIGIEKQQVYSLLVDLINLYIIAMYTVTFRNPILSTQMKKVFWQFPQKNQKGYEDRLEPTTRKLVDFIYSPIALYQQGSKVNGKKLQLNEEEEKNDRNIQYQDIKLPKKFSKDLSIQQFNFIGNYRKNMQIQLNDTLTNYVDITYDAIWSEDFVKEKKREIKNNSIFFRLVKRGSVLIYLTFHILTILIILLMSVTRESLLSLGYIFILLPSIKDGAEVLKQRELKIEMKVKKKEEEMKKLSQFFPSNCRAELEVFLETEKKSKKGQIQQDIVDYFLKKDTSIELKNELQQLDLKNDIEAQKLLKNKNYSEFLDKLKNDQNIRGNRYEVILLLYVEKLNNLTKGSPQEQIFRSEKETISKIDKEIKDLNRQLATRKIKELQRGQNKKQKNLEWNLIRTMKNSLLIYAFFDFLMSIIYQLPLPSTSLQNQGFSTFETIIGLTKIFEFPDSVSQKQFSAKNLFSSKVGDAHLSINTQNLITQAFNCVIIVFIIVQGQIFESTGYQKYINQDDGSMDLLVQLSELKAKSLTYVFNNFKIRKITSVQKHKEKLVAIVENIKQKLQKWRRANKNLLKLGNLENIQDTKPQDKFIKQFSEKEQLIEAAEERQLAIQKALVNMSQNKFEGKDKDTEIFELFKKALVNLVEEKKKTVKFDKEVLDREEEKDKEENFDDELFGPETKISQEEISEKTNLLIEQLLAKKLKKRGKCVRFYLWLHETFTEQILFKNEKSELEEIVRSHASGEVKVPTEFEKLMRTELQELVKIHLDKKINNKSFQIAIHKLKKAPEKNTLLELTEMDKKIKFSDMNMSFEFTRSFAMFINYIETFFCILVSQSETFIYFGMIFSMYMNAGLISLFYPIASFGYGMLEEKRTDKVFWRWIRWYTTGLLLFKFIATLKISKEYFFETDSWKNIQAITLFGVLSSEDGITSTVYMLPEIIIICFIMLNEIKLKLLGLYENRELDIEMITDGIIRIRCKGDEQLIKQRLALQSHSNMEPLMTSCREKKLIDQEFYLQKKRQIQIDLTRKLEVNKEYLVEEYQNPNFDFCIALELQQKNPEKNYNQMDQEGFDKLKSKYNQENLDQFQKNKLEDEQLQSFKDISQMMYNTALDFDLDSPGKVTLFDELIKKNAIQKTLENDSICYVEGHRRPTEMPFPTEQEFENFNYQESNWENMSCGDFEEEFGEKFDHLAERKKDQKGFFDSKPYFDTLFPSLKIQKPGGDWYGCTTLTLSLIAIYIFMFFEKFTFDTYKFPFMKKESLLFDGEMTVTVILVVIIIIFERIANRTDTKGANPERFDFGQKGDKEKRSFSNDDFIVRSQTMRSMTVKIQKTQKTTDLDLNEQGTQNFLENMEMDEDEIDRARTRITKQQKCKYFIHWFMLVGGHIYIFWYIPIKTNIQLHNSALCDRSNKYGCSNFHDNGYLRGLYMLLIVYLIFSSIQLSQGMPLKRKASSVLQYYNDLAKIGADLFVQIPFAVEIRCTIDYVSAKTSLDFFQTYQLYFYHYFFYTTMLGNRYYIVKKVGQRQTLEDKWLCGYLTGFLIMTLCLGSLYLFSSWSIFVGLNPIDTAQLQFNYVVSNKIVMDENDRHVINKSESLKDYKNESIVDSNVTYNLYINSNPNIKKYNEQEFFNKYLKKTAESETHPEHLTFNYEQVQDLLIPVDSELKWELSAKMIDSLFKDFDSAVEYLEKPELKNFTLQYDFIFGRRGPVGSEKANVKVNRTLDVSNYFDCMTAQELKKISQLQCEDKNQYQSVIWTKAFIPEIVLGMTKTGTELILSDIDQDDQKLDFKVTYFCNQTWKIEGKNGISNNSPLLNGREIQKEWLFVKDVQTCQLANLAANKTEEEEIKRILDDLREKGTQGKSKQQLQWGKIKITIFSMLLVTSVLAAYSPLTFFGGIVVIAASTLKGIFVLMWADANLYECTHNMPLIKLCEAVYMYRHEEDLINEEQTYRMIQEIVRSSEFIKAITGSSLRGDMDPMLDKLDETQKQRLKHLMKLEAKGFDVEELKTKILKTNPNQDGVGKFTQEDELK